MTVEDSCAFTARGPTKKILRPVLKRRAGHGASLIIRNVVVAFTFLERELKGRLGGAATARHSPIRRGPSAHRSLDLKEQDVRKGELRTLGISLPVPEI